MNIDKINYKEGFCKSKYKNIYKNINFQGGLIMDLSRENREKLNDLKNEYVLDVVQKAIKLCKPDKVKVITDSKEDIAYVRELALKTGEENKLNLKGHTYHFDGYYDQARDKENTRYLLTGGEDLGSGINSIEREKGLKEVLSYFDGSMKGKVMLVRFFSLGPNDSIFSIPALQITDSSYVAHSEDILYRTGYSDFKKLNGSDDFFYFLHSAGKLENGVSVDVDKRRVYIDLKEDRVFSVNNQYAGNSLGLKKLAFRLAINKASNEDWLAEHMFISGVHGPGDRVSYFTGAFPSACGKTSTAMIPGQTVVGDDIAYLKDVNGKVKAANVEAGLFGILRDVNSDDDPVIYKTLTTPREMIFSNVLINDGKPYWLGMGKEIPDEGMNFSGKWYKGKKDENGKEISPAHKNARYTIRIEDLDNCDRKYNDPQGVKVEGFVYGGRDSDTNIPVAETLSWAHGVFVGSCLESETTSATLGKVGERKHNPMANLDFLSIPLGKYIKNHLQFGKNVKKSPKIFAVNYFLKDEETGNYLNGILDKKVWLQWMERRVNGEVEAKETPVGYIPLYSDLKKLFTQYLDKEYSREEYTKQFAIRVDNYIEKYKRIDNIFAEIPDLPDKFKEELQSQQQRLLKTKNNFARSVISPLEF